jgi:integrase
MDRKNIQEVSKQKDSAWTLSGAKNTPESSTDSSEGEAASVGRQEGLAKTNIRYWKSRLLQGSYTRDGKKHQVKEWSVKIQHLGRRMTFALSTTNKDLAASKARKIYSTIVSEGWDAAEALFNPAMLVRKDDPSLGDFFAEVESKAGLRPKTFRNYQSALRTIVKGAFKIPEEKSRYDGRSGGAREWAATIDAIKLAALTPDHVQKWKVAFIRAAGSSPIAEAAAKRTVNSYIRCARSLFSNRILRFIKLSMPNPMPFQGIEMEEKGNTRYRSKINTELLVMAAKGELREVYPEVYKAFLLGLFCGLRRKEIDLLEWKSIDWANNQISIELTEHFKPKTEDSDNSVEVDPEVLTELRKLMAVSKTPFVLTSENQPTTKPDRQYYRCKLIFEHLTKWLRSKGVEAAKPIHELRKEFGSQVNQRHGIYAASRALRHADITTSTRHYIAKQQRVTVGLGHLLTTPAIQVVPPNKNAAQAST